MIRINRTMGSAAPKAAAAFPVNALNSAIPPKQMIPNQANVTAVLSSI